jgi:hypothetical protein
MADNRTIIGEGDRIRINMNEDYEVRYWTQKWNVSREELAAHPVATQFGPDVLACRCVLSRGLATRKRL